MGGQTEGRMEGRLEGQTEDRMGGHLEGHLVVQMEDRLEGPMAGRLEDRLVALSVAGTKGVVAQAWPERSGALLP